MKIHFVLLIYIINILLIFLSILFSQKFWIKNFKFFKEKFKI